MVCKRSADTVFSSFAGERLFSESPQVADLGVHWTTSGFWPAFRGSGIPHEELYICTALAPFFVCKGCAHQCFANPPRVCTTKRPKFLSAAAAHPFNSASFCCPKQICLLGRDRKWLGVSKNWARFWESQNKDCSVLGSIEGQ